MSCLLIFHEGNSYRFILNKKVVTGYVAEETNPNFELWRPKWPWLGKKWSKCMLYTYTLGTRVPHVIFCSSVPESLISITFHSTTSQFWVAGHFETSAPNNHKITLNTKRGCIIYKYVLLSITESYIFQSIFSSHFQVTRHFETTVPNDLKMTWTAQC